MAPLLVWFISTSILSPTTLPSPVLLEVTRRQSQRILASLQPLQNLRAQSSRHSLLPKLVATTKHVALVDDKTLESLWTSNADRPVGGDRDGLVVIVVEDRGWAHETRNNARDGVVGDCAATEVRRVEPAAQTLSLVAGLVSGISICAERNRGEESRTGLRWNRCCQEAWSPLTGRKRYWTSIRWTSLLST
jgi:hypothetical protein